MLSVRTAEKYFKNCYNVYWRKIKTKAEQNKKIVSDALKYIEASQKDNYDNWIGITQKTLYDIGKQILV